MAFVIFLPTSIPHQNLRNRSRTHLATPMTIAARQRRPFHPVSSASTSDNATSTPDSTLPIQTTQSKSPLRDTLRTALIIVAHLLFATTFLSFAEGWSLLDALYVSVVVATTVGYGDITPLRPVSKAFMAVYAVLSVVIIGALLQSLVQKMADVREEISGKAAAKLTDSHVKNSKEIENSLLASSREAVARARSRLFGTVALFVIALVSGAFLYRHFLNASFIDLFYFLAVTVTTVGLGDIHPISPIGKAYAVVWLIFSSLGFANILSQYTELRIKKHDLDTTERLLSAEISAKMFSEIDVDKNDVLSQSEYLGYILCQLGKTTPQEVKGIMSRFKQLDKDGSGVIARREITRSPDP